MDLDEIIKKLTSGEVPVATLGGAGVIVLVLGLRVAKRSSKIILVVAALGLLAGAAWWQFHEK